METAAPVPAKPGMNNTSVQRRRLAPTVRTFTHRHSVGIKPPSMDPLPFNSEGVSVRMLVKSKPEPGLRAMVAFRANGDEKEAFRANIDDVSVWGPVYIRLKEGFRQQEHLPPTVMSLTSPGSTPGSITRANRAISHQQCRCLRLRDHRNMRKFPSVKSFASKHVFAVSAQYGEPRTTRRSHVGDQPELPRKRSTHLYPASSTQVPETLTCGCQSSLFMTWRKDW